MNHDEKMLSSGLNREWIGEAQSQGSAMQYDPDVHWRLKCLELACRGDSGDPVREAERMHKFLRGGQ